MNKNIKPTPGWRKSSYSGGDTGQCVEVSTNVAAPLIRDSKNPEGPCLALRRSQFATLVQQVKAGELDL